MKKALIIVSIFVIYFVIYLLQVNFFNWFTIAGIQPNLFVLLALFIGIFMNGKMGAILGFILGLYTDFLFSNTIGISAFLLGAVGFCGEILDKKFSKDSKITIVLMGSIVTAIYEILLYIFNIIKMSINVNLIAFIYILAIEIIYNAFIIIIFYPLIHKFGIYAESVFKNKKMFPKYF
ncbi:MAG: rod shape-determining protein MreD [Clostridia bacterium]|nr:rod shape-determining protein MreD [Clostridia bacterium]